MRLDFPTNPLPTDRDDGLELKNLYITAAARCAPPDNKPLPQELANCASYLDREMEGLKNLRVVVALGRIAFEAYLNYLKRRGLLPSKNPYQFGMGPAMKCRTAKFCWPRIILPTRTRRPENLRAKCLRRFLRKRHDWRVFR